METGLKLPEPLRIETDDTAYPPRIVLDSEFSRCSVSLHGAQVLSFIPKGGRDLLWVSREALFVPGKAIRGGIPVCWPWFGPHPEDPAKPAHGFARTVCWEVAQSGVEDGVPFALLRLVSDAATHALFGYDFALELRVAAGVTLTLSLTTHNTDSRPFGITEALHSYFHVGKIEEAEISGLEGCGYIDQLLENRRFTQEGVLRIDAETDRIYAGDAKIQVAGNSRILTVEKSGSRSTVVWNPWKQKAARLADFGDTEYREMLCIETANAGDHGVTIQPGGSHTMTLEIGAQ